MIALRSTMIVNHASSLLNAFAPNSKKLKYTACNFLLLSVPRGLPGVTSSLYNISLHGFSGEGGVVLDAAVEKIVERLAGCQGRPHKRKRVGQPDCFLGSAHAVHHDFPVDCTECSSRASRKACRWWISGMPSLSTASSTAASALALICGRLRLNASSFLSFARRGSIIASLRCVHNLRW